MPPFDVTSHISQSSNLNSSGVPALHYEEEEEEERDNSPSRKRDSISFFSTAILAISKNIFSWIFFVSSLFFISFLFKAFQIFLICIQIMGPKSIGSSKIPNSIECAFMHVVVTTFEENFSCTPSHSNLDWAEFSRIQAFALTMAIFLVISSLTCLGGIVGTKLIALNFVCIASSILFTHAISTVVLLMISVTSVSIVPYSTLFSISLDICIATSVVVFSHVYQSHSIMYFKPTSLHYASNTHNNSQLYSIKKIESTISLNETYRKFDHVDSSIVSS